MYNDKMVAFGESRSVIRELAEYGRQLAAKEGKDKVFDFTLGNPSVPTPQKVNKTIAEKLSDPTIHSYTAQQGLPWVREKIADYNRRVHGLDLSADKIYLTCGANAGLSILLHTIVTDEQNEVVVFIPYYPEYAVFAKSSGGKVVAIPLDQNYQIDFDKFAKALSAKTAAVVVNSPNNPSGIVYSAETLAKMAEILEQAQEKFGTSIVLISDEPYREITFDCQFKSPLAYYKNSVLCYSYSKSFSLPGERIGYVAISNGVKQADRLFNGVMGAGRALGYVCAPSIFQQVIAECIDEPSNIRPYRDNRDSLVALLQKLGFETVNPQGAFYLLVKAPSGDGEQFADVAKQMGLLFVPTNSFGLLGFVRVATCVSAEMIERSVPVWEKLAKLTLK